MVSGRRITGIACPMIPKNRPAITVSSGVSPTAQGSPTGALPREGVKRMGGNRGPYALPNRGLDAHMHSQIEAWMPIRTPP